MESETAIASKVQRLRCSVQNYDWGRKGVDSTVAELYALNSGSEIDPEKPYAEIWMGTHDSGPSFLVPSEHKSNGNLSVEFGSHGESLKSWISKNPSVLGEKVVQRWGSDLPFLFKVLSVAKALSIQAHPDKELAKTLHKLQPSVYKDDNHKPEMALAITDFEALCGFISLQELKSVLHDVPEIVELVGSTDANQLLNLSDQDAEEKVKIVLRSIFTKLMSASKEMIIEATSKLKDRLHFESQVRQLTDKERLVLELEKQYPADVGVISAFFFNYVKLNPGEALYLGPNEPHAYLFGECIECMATSDNVVRAGLTPKHRDVNTLCSMLTYKQGYPEILQGVPLNPYVRRYLPPFDEFEVDSCNLPRLESVAFPAVPGPSISMVTRGEGIMHTSFLEDVIAEGDVLFIPADTEFSITSASDLQLYRTGVNSKFFQAS
ncbi:putative mannose-6-phosphate isomerase [Morus notabilis]|uniref:mannose-6-phosphate isomerase n=3 Tax=Morus notabilis TaxID=981085 RepID=W9RY11_9ROSA|nr:mannose-6-phosphate isomerase 1 isoform X2 [Morus notabilis]XP_024028888.1 mannose-6-phosphate isomerase 1 isoform X2 [Morus notabilis]EXC17063.1 putative mannose-6-phosphate isomerase [Morus notabilis]